MTPYAKITDNHLQYPTAAEFVGVINWQSHDPALRSRGYVPVTNMPDEQEGKTLHIDRVEFHQQTETRTVPTQVEVDDYTENPETHEMEKSGSHLEWQEQQVEVDTSYITVEEHHYEDIAVVEPEPDQHLAEFEFACAQFRAVCAQIAEFLHIESFRGGFDEYAAMNTSPYTEAAPVRANTLMHEWSGMNQLCTYLGAKVGLGQPAWWYRCWELAE